MENNELINQAIAYHKNQFVGDLYNMVSKCKTNTNEGFYYVLEARDLSRERLSDTSLHEIFFLTFWCYSHAIVHHIGLSQSDDSGYDIMKRFSKLTGYPMFSLGMGGIMSAKQNMFEFSISKRLSDEERKSLKEVASGVSSYFVKELKLFLDGKQPELIHSTEYNYLVKNLNDKKDSICKAVVAEVEEAVNYKYSIVTRSDDKIEIKFNFDYPLGKFNMIKVKREDGSSYFIGETTVTYKIWNLFAKAPYSENSQNPVTDINKEDIDCFINDLSHVTGLNFRLPTGEEWTWAAKGGLKSMGYKYIGSNDVNEIAWWKENSDEMIHAVALKKPNELGLYDMAGNVWELTSDAREESFLLLTLLNPNAKPSTHKVYSDYGGCYFDKPDHFTPTFKGHVNEDEKSSILGFRLVCD